MKIKLKRVEYSRKAIKYIKATKYFWVQFKRILLTVKL